MSILNIPLDIVIEGGQSNAEGSGIGPVKSEFSPTNNILYLNAEKEVKTTEFGLDICYFNKPFVIDIAKERKINDNIYGDLALTFSEEYVKNGLLDSGRAVLIVRGAIGGTGFKKEQWGLNDIVYKKMIEMTDYALSLNKNNKIIAYFWHQGEHDAFEGNSPENYHIQLTNMLKDVRKRYGEIPFIAGDFCNEWKNKNLSICKPIVSVIRQVIKENEKSGFVETRDLMSNNQRTGNGDDIHFCRESLHLLGRRYFSEWKSIIDKDF